MKAVVVTGASSGIGLATARYLAEQGFHVFGGVRKEADAQHLRASGSERLRPIFIDVTQPDMIAAAAAEVQAALDEAADDASPGLVGLVNNAGIAVPGPLEFIAIDDFRRQIEVNLTGQLAVTQAFLPMLRQAQGRVINISSLSGTLVFPLMGAYAISKWGLEAMTDALRQELYAWGIEVVSIQPGSVDTPIWQRTTEKTKARYADMPEAAHTLYGPLMAAMNKRLRKTARQGMPVEVVTRTIHKALTARRPRSRYFVVEDGWRMKLLGWLPDRWRDALLRRSLGLPGRS